MWKLIDKHGVEVHPGDVVYDFKGDSHQVSSFEPPRHEGSIGRVYVRDMVTGSNRLYYPSVFGLKIVME
jgi:hypothetical protein